MYILFFYECKFQGVHAKRATVHKQTRRKQWKSQRIHDPWPIVNIVTVEWGLIFGRILCHEARRLVFWIRIDRGKVETHRHRRRVVFCVQLLDSWLLHGYNWKKNPFVTISFFFCFVLFFFFYSRKIKSFIRADMTIKTNYEPKVIACLRKSE